MDAKEALLQHLEELKRSIAGVRQTLRLMDKQERLAQQQQLRRTYRFFNVRTLHAMRTVLEERGGSMPLENLIQQLINEGAAIGKKRSHHNVRISIEVNEKIGNVLIRDGVVSLPPKAEAEISAASAKDKSLA